MGDSTELRCWPSCIRSLDWSQDCIIALASDERVELLFPNTESDEPDGALAQWRHFPLQVPWFTTEELPVKAPAPLKYFSVGEEISASFPFQIAWSPPGVAKHRRCALAVLTTNLVLSIWSSEGKPYDHTSWDRRLIANDALEEYFSATIHNSTSRVKVDASERLRLRQRIRAFTWAPSMDVASLFATVGTQLFYGRQLIAVSNDDNQIIILAIDSPTSTFGSNDSWRSEALNHFILCTQPEGNSQVAFTFDDLIQEQCYASQLAWSPWMAKGDTCYSILAYATNVDVRARVVSYSQGIIKVAPEVFYPQTEIRFAGPMEWSPKVGENGTVTLALFTNTDVVCLIISVTDASVVHRTKHRRDDSWDVISGAVWDVQGKASPRLHFSRQSMTTRATTAALELSSEELVPISLEDFPYWRQGIVGSEAHYSVKHELKGNANAKVWGLSTSPLEDFMAACHTLHPTDMIEYGTANERRTTVAISHLWGAGAALEFPAKAVGAEGIYFTSRRWIEYNVEGPDSLPPVIEEIQAKLSKTYGSIEERQTVNSTPNNFQEVNDIHHLVTSFKEKAFLEPRTLEDRFQILTSKICTPRESKELARTMIGFRLAKKIQDTPAALSYNNHFSKTIHDCSSEVIRLVNELASDDEAVIPRMSSTESFTESCVFCGEAVKFEDVESASCPTGHEFQRCGLSFLTIQEPASAKYCGICDTPFLGDEFVLRELVYETGQESRHGSLPGENEEGVDQETTTPNDRNGQYAEAAANGEQIEHEDNETPDDSSSERAEQELHRPPSVGDVPVATPQSVASNRNRSTSRVSDDLQQKTKKSVSRSQSRDIPVTLARVLFLACDACIYCGGKFVG